MQWRVDRLLLVAVVLAACGGATHTAGDDEFVTRMIPHHRLGMELIDEATVHSDGVELRRMVFEMGGYHHDEAAQLSTWATRWHLEEERTFPGDLRPADVNRLSSLTGPAHDAWWLRLMIDHHRGALVIAREAVVHASDPGVVSMARSVITVQEQQIEDMEGLSGRICAGDPTLPGC